MLHKDIVNVSLCVFFPMLHKDIVNVSLCVFFPMLHKDTVNVSLVVFFLYLYRLNCCNYLLAASDPKTVIKPLEHVHNSAATLVLILKFRRLSRTRQVPPSLSYCTDYP